LEIGHKSGYCSEFTRACGAAIEAAEDVIAQVVLSHHFRDFAVAAAAQERLEDSSHAAAAARFSTTATFE
jgi:hypothetical protein